MLLLGILIILLLMGTLHCLVSQAHLTIHMLEEMCLQTIIHLSQISTIPLEPIVVMVAEAQVDLVILLVLAMLLRTVRVSPKTWVVLPPMTSQLLMVKTCC